MSFASKSLEYLYYIKFPKSTKSTSMCRVCYRRKNYIDIRCLSNSQRYLYLKIYTTGYDASFLFMKVDECEYTKTGSKRKGKRKKMLKAKLADFIATSSGMWFRKWRNLASPLDSAYFPIHLCCWLMYI